MKKGKVEVEMKDGSRKKVAGLLSGCGCLAVHKMENSEGNTIPNYHVLTHALTGKRIASFNKQKEAKLLADELEATGEFNFYEASPDKIEEIATLVLNTRKELGI